jgi:hypothetical protein
MPSLDEAYDHGSTGIRQPRRALAGLALVGVGALAVVAALALIAAAGTNITARSYAGALAGAGVPVMLLGVVVVLPASRRNRLGVVAGTLVAGGGVALFARAYPEQWVHAADSLAFETLLVYGLGCAVALWFVFAAIASFRRRNDPQGTVRLEVVRQGETQTLEVSRDRYRQLVSDGGDADRVIEELEE